MTGKKAKLEYAYCLLNTTQDSPSTVELSLKGVSPLRESCQADSDIAVVFGSSTLFCSLDLTLTNLGWELQLASTTKCQGGGLA